MKIISNLFMNFYLFSGLTNDIDIDDNFIQHYDDFEAKDYLIVDDPIAPKYRKKSKIKR